MTREEIEKRFEEIESKGEFPLTAEEKAALEEAERLEDEADVKRLEEALKRFAKNPKTYSMEEVEKELGL